MKTNQCEPEDKMSEFKSYQSLTKAQFCSRLLQHDILHRIYIYIYTAISRVSIGLCTKQQNTRVSLVM